MWKRVITALVMLLSVFSVGYTYYNFNIYASNTLYQSGGDLQGRINIGTSGLSLNNIGFKKGDKIYVGGTNPKNGNPLGWQLIYNAKNYATYDVAVNGSITDLRTLTTTYTPNGTASAWYSMTTDSIAKKAEFSTIPNSLFVSMPNQKAIYDLTESNVYNDIQNLSFEMSDAKQLDLLRPNDLSAAIETVTKAMQPQMNGYIKYSHGKVAEAVIASTNGNNVFMPDIKLLTSNPNTPQYTLNGGYHLNKKDLAFLGKYSGLSCYYSDSTLSGFDYGNIYRSSIDTDGTIIYESCLETADVRPSAMINLDQIVFGVSPGTTQGLGAVTEPNLQENYTSIYNATSTFKEMKLRILNKEDPITVSFAKITNKDGNTITKVTKDSEIQLWGKAENRGSTVSALFFKNGKFVYYKPLDQAKGNNQDFPYILDTTGISTGSYQVAIVNEVYDTSTTVPAYSSLLSEIKTLDIVEPVSISVSPKTGLEYGNNVNNGDVAATYTTSNGVNPITVTLVSDTSVSGHVNDYQMFSVSNGNIIVNDPNGLDAGDYYFKVNAIDDNGDPAGGVNSSTVHITVAKTNPTIAFDNPNQTKKSVADASTAWNETATPTPNTGTKVTYSVSGGDTYLIDIDSDTGAITYKGNGAFGKVKIKATADDDPATGNDNYNSAFTEKEIIIYKQVDGSVTPHANSSDSITPTFTATDTNVKTNGIIGTIQGTTGTPDNIGGSSTITYKYGIETGGDSSLFSVDANTGVIKTTGNLGVQSYHITVTVSDKWSTKRIPVTINVGVANAEDLRFYETSAAVNMISQKSVKVTDTNVSVYATVKGSTNNNPVTYRIKDGSTNIITINPNSGVVTINGVGTVTIVAEKEGGVGQAKAVAELTFTVTAGTQNFIYTDDAGNELPKDGSSYKAYSEVYAPNKTIQLYTAGNPTGSTVMYQLKAGSPTDVISVDAGGLVTILNASLNNQMGKVIVQATSHDPSGNYADKTIELSINIEKGTRTISFKEKPIYVTNGKGKVTPVTEVDGVVDTDGDVLIEVDTNEDHTIAWTNDNKTIDYNYSGDTGKDIKIHATKPMNRNYKAAEADGTIHIMGPDENILAITSPGQIIYGDHFTIRSSQYDADSTNVQYTFEVDKTTYISNPTVNGNSAEFDAKQFSGSNKTTITVTRTADGETMLSKQVQVTVLPKPIEIIIDDKEKLKGEINPTLTYQDFSSDLVSWNGVQDVIQENDIKLSTTAKTNSNAGSYPIKGDSNSLNKTYSNYSFSFKEGTLKITEETIEDDWYHLELDDGNNTAYTGGWVNKDINIVSDHNEYINLSLDQSTWKPTQVTISIEGETNQSFWMKKDSGAITKEKQETIKIDKTAPKVKNIKAKDSNNKLQDIINKLSGGIFFKPGTAFEITTDDSKDDLKVSGTKEIAYKVYKLESQARAGDELIKDGTLTVTNEKASITIGETTGIYRVCVIPTDNAGNTGTESCHEVELKKIDVDVDGDGKPDFNDPDGDGCPDLNIKWKDPNTNKWIVVNGDRDYDGIPDFNIDSDGDGIPDLNIDTDNDGKPDLNLVILKKADWKPTKCVKADIDNGILEEYCTGTNVKPTINIDVDGDRIPDINIDTNGDMKADINVDTDNDNIANTNLSPINVWKPNKDYTHKNFRYDTMKIDPLLNIDSDGDGRPDINIDLDGDGEPDINIDVDGDGIPDTNIDGDGDGKPDINVDTDGDGKPDENIKDITEWKPNKNVDGDLPYDTMDFNDIDETKKPSDDDTDVKGSYYPGDNVGGAITGDSTNLILYINTILLSIGLISYLIYKKQKDTFQ